MGSNELVGFVGILRESIKILARNGQAMAIIATTSILLNSLILFTTIFSTKAVFLDLLAKETLLILTGPGSPGFPDLLVAVKEDIRIILGVESAIFLASFIVSLFSMVSTVLVSATTHRVKRLSFRDLVSRLARSCIRPFITSFHINLYVTGYIFFVLAMLIPLLVINLDRCFALKAISISLGSVALIFWIYLSVVGVLAMVISVIEESCYGIEALGKAGGLVKGKRLHGFAVNSLSVLPLVILFQGSRMIGDQKSASIQIIIGFLLTVFSCLVGMFQYMNYTVLYFQCKKIHGEEIQLQGTMEYSKVLDNEDIP